MMSIFVRAKTLTGIDITPIWYFSIQHKAFLSSKHCLMSEDRKNDIQQNHSHHPHTLALCESKMKKSLLESNPQVLNFFSTRGAPHDGLP